MSLINCAITAGVGLSCRVTGGLAGVYIQNYDSTTFGYTLATASNSITAFSATASKFFKFETELEGSSFAQPASLNNENGTIFYEPTITMTLLNLTSELTNTLRVLNKGSFRVLVLDNNGKYWLCNADGPMKVSTAEIGAGKNFGDMSGANVTMISKQKDLAYEVSGAAALSIISLS